MKKLIRLLSLMTVVVLSACGGGGGSEGSCRFSCTPGGGTTSASVADLDVQINPGTLVNTGTATATATITALDANRQAVAGAAITLGVDSGVITPLVGTGNSGTASPVVTDSAGKLLATVSLGSNLALRKITVTAASGSIQRSNTLQVVSNPVSAQPTSIELLASATEVLTSGDPVVIRAFVKDSNNNALPGAPLSFTTSTGTLTQISRNTDTGGSGSASITPGADRTNRDATITVSSGTITSTLSLPIRGTQVTLSGPSSLILGNTATFDAVVKDSKGNALSDIAVTATSSLNNSLVSSAPRTDSTGRISFTYRASTAGTDSLQFSGAGASLTTPAKLVVSAQDFAFVFPEPSVKVPVGSPQAVQVRFRSGGVAQAGKQVNFNATGGALSATSAITDSNGVASVNLSSRSAGPITVQATVAGSGTGGTGAVSATLPLLIVANNPSKLVLQVSPTAIAPNTSDLGANQTTLSAKVTDEADNPVQDVTVNFSRVVDPSGGNLLQASTVTGPDGTAAVIYRAGPQSTADNGVVFSGTVAGTTVSGRATLTVNQSALFIDLGTGNVIQNLDEQTYKDPWVAYVTDANSIAVNGVNLTIKAVPTAYLTGALRFNKADSIWVYDEAYPLYQCRTEDANSNGILDAGEDDNGDGVLWPGNVIAVGAGAGGSTNTIKTVDGRASLYLAYAESYSPWVQVKLTVSANVSGTESSTSAIFIVRPEAKDFGQQTPTPAGRFSPFGIQPTDVALARGLCTHLLGPIRLP